MKASLICLFFVFISSSIAEIYNVLDFGAVGDGKSVDTLSIQKAFAAASKGGDVLLPAPHIFLSFPISFTGSNVRLVVEKGATLKASNNISSWPLAGEQYANFITATNVNNISIIGGGTIDGNGELWWDLFTNNTLKYSRPDLVYFHGTKHCLFEGVTFLNSPNHNLEIGCSYAEISNVNIIAPGDGHLNTDGVDVHGSPFYIHDCNITVGDDNVAVHANDTLIENCYFGTGHGVGIGNGWLNNITVRNSTFDGTVQATRIKTHMGDSGLITDITFENITMHNIMWPFCIDMFYEDAPQFAECIVGTNVGPTTQIIKNIVYKDITISGVQQQAGIFACQPSSPCTDIQLVNIVVTDKPAPTWTCMNAFGSNDNVNPTSCLKEQV